MIFSAIAVGLSGALGLAGAAAITGLQVAVFAGSVIYQNMRQNQLKREADKRKQVSVPVLGEPFYLPLCYGRVKVAGGITRVRVSNNYNHADIDAAVRGLSLSNGAVFANVATDNKSYLFVQQAICFGGINRIIDVEVDSKNWDQEELKFGQRMHFYYDGTIADPMATANATPATNLFTSTCYMSGAFRLNRESYQYSGVPAVAVYLEGQLVPSVVKTGSVYTVSPTKTYSNNPARVLLDYLTNPVYGRGLPATSLDLKTFYDATIICDRVAMTEVPTDGRIFGRRPAEENEDGDITYNEETPPRDLPLYECNAVIDTERSIRENIELILESMNEADLIWSGGLYKLTVQYPKNQSDQDQLVVMEVTENNMVRDTVTITWPDASTRYAQITAQFRNENENFVDDSVSWPETYDAVYNTYVAEDYNTVLRSDVYLPCTTDPNHARAKAEQMVRTSRNSYSLSFTMNKDGVLLEPGDIIRVTNPTSYINNEDFKVTSVKVNSDFTANIEAAKFNWSNFAFNVNDTKAYVNKVNYFTGVRRPTNIVAQKGSDANNVTRSIKLSWDPVANASEFVVDYYDENGFYDLFSGWWSNPDQLYTSLGVTKDNSFNVFGVPNGTYVFRVRTRSNLGRLSKGGVTKFTYVQNNPPTPTVPTLTEELYYTNVASGVKSKVKVSWILNDNSLEEINTAKYSVSYKLATGTNWISIGDTSGDFVYLSDLTAGYYVVRLQAISYAGFTSAPVEAYITVVGLAAIPANPSSVTLTNGTGDLSTLFWAASTDLDVLHGGSVEVRFAPSIGGIDNWNTAYEVIKRLPGSATHASVSSMTGTYFVKFADSSGNFCANAISVENDYSGHNFTQSASYLNAAFGGFKTNCTLVSSTLTQTAGFDQMKYRFLPYPADLGEITAFKVVIGYTGSCTTRGTLVSDYISIAKLESFDGPLGQGVISLQIQTSNDDITYTPWLKLTSGTYTGRYVRLQLVADTADTNSFYQFTAITAKILSKKQIQQGTVSSSATVDTTVTFPVAFYGGTAGATLPTITAHPVGGAAGDNVVIVSRSKTNFVVSVYNAGARVVRTLDWTAVGI